MYDVCFKESEHMCFFQKTCASYMLHLKLDARTQHRSVPEEAESHGVTGSFFQMRFLRWIIQGYETLTPSN